MKHRLLYIPILFLFMLSFVDCAKKGTPNGGQRDTIPPIIVNSSPENYSTNFNTDEIEIRFNEYIKLNEINTELIISPPMEYKPIITPLSTSKTLKIKLLDTLKENTTYSFNFGNSIEDNNEGNKFEYFKYVFSTGSYIDSLKLTGKVKDAELIAPEIPTTVVLYEINDKYKDSTVYLKKPTYITVTKDSTGTFELTNLKAGKYKLLALKEKSNDYIFQSKSDKIAFVESTITIPTDSVYDLTLFKETPLYKLARPSQLSRNHLVFGYEGKADSLDISLLSDVPSDFEFRTYRDFKKDSINYWFKPSLKVDSLNFVVKNGAFEDTVTVRMRELKKDSLLITALKAGTLKLTDTIQIAANTPISEYDSEKISVMAKDSTIMQPAIFYRTKTNTAFIDFPKTEDNRYAVSILPGAFTDFYGKTNDSINFDVTTRLISDYGTLNLTINNADRFPVIVQLVDSKYKVISEKFISENAPVFFDEILPGKYFLRIIYDDNDNKKWDTGNYLNILAPEKIVYYPKQIEVRANWSLNETFTLK